MAEVFSSTVRERIRDDDITVRRMRQKYGWGREKCENELAKKVAAGILFTVTVLNEYNQETTAWRKPVDIED